MSSNIYAEYLGHIKIFNKDMEAILRLAGEEEWPACLMRWHSADSELKRIDELDKQLKEDDNA